MSHSALLFGLLIGAGVLIGAGIAIMAERRRMPFTRSALITLALCVVVLFGFSAVSLGSNSFDSVARALLLSLLELPLVAVPSLVAMFVVRKALRKRGRPKAGVR